MNIHEYQAKELFATYGIAVPRGKAAQKPEAFAAALDEAGDGAIVVKSQIHAGGRGKGTFTNGYKGGVKVVKQLWLEQTFLHWSVVPTLNKAP